MKAVIGLGCSFVAGLEAGGKDKSFIKYIGDALNANVYNFAVEGQGNLGSVMQLLSNPIDYKSYESIEIFYMPTGLNRIDIINLNYSDSMPFMPVFPSVNSPGVVPEVYELEVAYGKYWTVQCQFLNFAYACSLLKLYTDKPNVNLTVFPAFNREYEKKLFDITIKRNNLEKNIPWDKFIKVDNCTNFFDWAVKQSGSEWKASMLDSHFQPRDKSLDGWIEERFHPSAKAHKLLAERLIKNVYNG